MRQKSSRKDVHEWSRIVQLIYARLLSRAALPCLAGLRDTPTMDRSPVTSSSIASVGYDPARQILEVEFRNGSAYQYMDVTPDEHDALMAATSKGAHFNLRIRDRYPYRQL